jgi:hypothetical protein
VEEIFRKIADREKNLPLCHNQPMKNILSASMVNVDITPYMAVAVDKKTGKKPYITSRKAHKEFLRRNDYVELPEAKPYKRELRGDFDLKKDLIQATKKVLNK